MDNSFRYHSELSTEQKAQILEAQVLRFLPLDYSHSSQEVFKIIFRSDAYAPAHSITLRTNVDGWGRDIFGGYYGGAWYFSLPKAEYEKGLEFKFFLDRTIWMDGGNLVLTAEEIARSNFEATYYEDRIQFQGARPKLRLPFDGLRVSEDSIQQAQVRNCYHEDREFDVIIIGSGMGGGILADALTDREPALDVLVLDIGCLDFATHIYNLPGDAGELDGRHQVHSYKKPDWIGFGGGLHMNLGGRSVVWAGVIPKMLDWELQYWPSDVANYLRNGGYDSAESLMHKEKKSSPYQEELISALQQEFKGVFKVQSLPRAYDQPEFKEDGSFSRTFTAQGSGTFSTAELLMDSLWHKGKGGGEHLHVNLNHMVTDLRRDGNRIAEVICHDLVANQRRTYRAKQFVLAAGSIESVRIALQSSLDRDHPLIGKGFTDHPAYFIGDRSEKPIFLSDTSPWAGQGVHAKIFFYPQAESGYRGIRFNTEVLINGDYWRERHADPDVLKDRTKRRETRVQFKFSFDAELNEENYVQLDKSNGGDGRGRKLSVLVKRVAESQNARDVIEELSKKMLAILGGPTGINVWEYGGWGADGTPAHAGGSMRMGHTSLSKDCVVDTNLKFLNIENLYACDLSVFPRIPAANPSLTLAALALRLSDHLASKFPRIA